MPPDLRSAGVGSARSRRIAFHKLLRRQVRLHDTIGLETMRAGAVYLPLNTAYTAGEVRYFLGDAEPTLFVCRPELAEPLRALAAEVTV